MNDNINLLGLQGLETDKIIESEKKIEIYAHTSITPQCCPHCGRQTAYVHSYRIQKIKDLPMRLKDVTIVLNKRRYICKECNKTFFEHYDFLPKYHQGTNRRNMGIIQSLSTNQSLKDIANRFNCSTNTVQRMLNISAEHRFALCSWYR